MGGAVSAGESNDDLVQNLVDADYVKTPLVEKVFRAVDRADYYLEDHRENAYKDLAWKHHNIHLSAPCIYAEVMESLKLEPGLSFLNLGSGTGYLSTLAGLIIGPYGVNHGVEYHADVIKYCKERLDYFKKEAVAFDEFDFCEPQFTQGNCLMFAPGSKLYDRVYCGAACPQEHENYMKNLISVGGILVMPLNDQLLQITRSSETTWETKNVLPVSFASLLLPDKDKDVEMVDLPDVSVLPLQEICRLSIRCLIRKRIEEENPGIGCARKRKPKKSKKEARNRKRINIVPMSMGMMILGNFEDSENEDGCLQSDTSQEELPSIAGEAEQESGSGEDDERHADDSHRDAEDDSHRDAEDEQEHASGRSGMPDILQQMADMQRRFYQIARREGGPQEQQNSDFDDEDLGIQEDIDNDGEDMFSLADNGKECAQEKIGKNRYAENNHNKGLEEISGQNAKDDDCTAQSPTSSTSSEDMEVETSTTYSTSNAIPITAGQTRNRYSSNTSVSTSYTSGFGTCSSVEEQPDLDVVKEIQSHDAGEVVDMSIGNLSDENKNRKADKDPNHDDNNSIGEGKDMSSLKQESPISDQPEVRLAPTGAKDNQPNSRDETSANRANGKGPFHYFENIIESDEEREPTEELKDRFCRPPCSLLSDPPRLSIMESPSSDDLYHDLEKSDNKQDNEEDSSSDERLHYKPLVREKIELLPIPLALKQYLLFYRT